MKIIPEPIFFELLKIESGIKKALIHILNQDDEDFEKKVTDIKAPAWIEFENIEFGQPITVKKHGKVPYVVRVDTGHKLFIDEIDDNNGITIVFEDGSVIQIAIIVEEVIKEIPDYKGTFAIDFGTTNSCYAYRSRVGEEADIESAFKKARTSDILPSVIFFSDVDKIHPNFKIGNPALFDIEENSSQTYSYFRSIKRYMGSDKLFTVLDKYSGLKPERRQRWKAEDIAGFYLSGLIKQAEIEIGSRIKRVIATYPVLYTKAKKRALVNAFKKAFDYLGRNIKEEDIILNLDESMAAGFNYIYGPLLDEFRVYESIESRNKLLTFDFGGGTIDVSLVDVNIKRSEDRKVKVGITVEGITGARHYGGDNVTLEVFKILKDRLALTIAQELKEEEVTEDPEEETVEEEKPVDDIFAAESKKDDFWSVDETEEESAEEAPEQEAEEAAEEDDLSEIVNNVDENIFKEAVKTVNESVEAVKRSITQNISLDQALRELSGEATLTSTMAKNQAEETRKAIETLCPTKFDVHKDEDPIKAKVARILFNEIWNEADRMKIRASLSPDSTGELGMEMKKVARYAGLEDHSVFNRNIKISINEIENKIRGEIARYISKAHELYKSTRSESFGTIQVEDKAAETTEDLTIILSGNSSRLAMVKELFLEIFDIQEKQIKMDDASIKKDVAQGACEELCLKKEFGGEEGLIAFHTEGFIDKLPYTIGLYQKDLALAGYESGFCPLIVRGTKLGYDTELTTDNPLIHAGVETLALYANYHDGADLFYLGWFDLTKPSGESERSFDIKDEGEDSFSIVLTITENRDLMLTNPRTHKFYTFIEKPDLPSAKENPFSGIF